MAAANTDKLRKLSRKWVGQIGAGGVADDTTTTIPLSSTTNLATDTAVTLVIDRVDSSGTKTPTLEETIVGVVSGSNIINSVRGVEGTAQAHSAGAVVEVLVTADSWNDLVDWGLVSHNQDGTHKSGSVFTLPQINDTTADHQYVFSVCELTADRTVALPLLTGNDEFVFKDHEQTLTNKTLTSPTMTSPKSDTLNEVTTDAGVTIDGLTIKDGGLSMGSDTHGDIYFRGATGLMRLAAGTSGHFLKTQGAGSDPVWAALTAMLYSDGRFKVGTFTRDRTAAGGNVAYTGVGFQPKAVIFIMGVNSTASASVGYDDATNHYCVAYATSNVWNVRTSDSINTRDNSSWEQNGYIISMDSDGFTIGWTKAGSPPAGTMQIFYLAFR